MMNLLLITIAIIFQFLTFKADGDKGIFLADPTVFLDRGTYYLYGTSSEAGFLVYQSKDLKTWSGPAGKVNGYALAKGQSFGKQGFWAPQVFKHKGVYFMAYTADERIAIATSNSPVGPFKQQVFKSLSGDTKQIDPFVFFDTNGKPYLYYVKLKDGNRIFVSKMKDDLSDLIEGTAKECIAGTAGWENTENVKWPVTEGPTVFEMGKRYYLIYSANDFRNPDYAVGYASSDLPTGPWKKEGTNPFINKEKLKFNGTGHGDLFKDKAGNYRYVMHTHNSLTVVSPRRTGIINLKITKGDRKGDSSYIITAIDSTFTLLSTK
jgi:xylan 1,4-beta-xylosidase